jgi:hypothetical protein
MNVSEREKYGNATIILSQVDNKLERRENSRKAKRAKV